MAEEEFQESEVIFPENSENEEDDENTDCGSSSHLCSGVQRNTKPNRRRRRWKKKKEEENSVPVDIPENVSGNSWFQCAESNFFDDDDGDEVVPPHVVVGRRIFAGKMAFSVCTGNGRTLKGRDLRQVRNSILRMTGFLET
ncbi:hypothetical protein U1Q18_009447 [Sarracenia purpurea var. burkii]